jgi:hypothetical protein
MHYRVVMPKDRAAASILQETLKHLKTKPEMRSDVSRLQSACCAPQSSIFFKQLLRLPW